MAEHGNLCARARPQCCYITSITTMNLHTRGAITALSLRYPACPRPSDDLQPYGPSDRCRRHHEHRLACASSRRRRPCALAESHAPRFATTAPCLMTATHVSTPPRRQDTAQVGEMVHGARWVPWKLNECVPSLAQQAHSADPASLRSRSAGQNASQGRRCARGEQRPRRRVEVSTGGSLCGRDRQGLEVASEEAGGAGAADTWGAVEVRGSDAGKEVAGIEWGEAGCRCAWCEVR